MYESSGNKLPNSNTISQLTLPRMALIGFMRQALHWSSVFFSRWKSPIWSAPLIHADNSQTRRSHYSVETVCANVTDEEAVVAE